MIAVRHALRELDQWDVLFLLGAALLLAGLWLWLGLGVGLTVVGALLLAVGMSGAHKAGAITPEAGASG